MSDDYADGVADGLAGRPPDSKRLAYGANRLNAYERGYIDSGKVVPDDNEQPSPESDR